MAQLELVVGPSRTGKTTYAKSREGFSFLCYDDMLYHTRWNFQAFKENLVNLLNNHSSEDFILDGWFSKYNWNPESVHDLKEKTNREIAVTCFYAPIEEVVARSECETRADILEVYRRLARFYRDDLRDIPFRFRDSEKEFSFSEFMRLLRPEMVTVTREEVLSFISELENLQNYDRYYQTIDLPYGISLLGYERTELTWQLIAKLVDFRGKTVLDAGCYHGFCCRGAEDAGARRVFGLDRVPKIIENAKRIGDMWGYETSFIQADLDEFTDSVDFDIVMCLNTIQYCKNPRKVVEKLFACGSTVIWEAHREFKKLFDAVPTHRLIHEVPSPRAELKRILYIYERTAPRPKKRWLPWL